LIFDGEFFIPSDVACVNAKHDSSWILDLASVEIGSLLPDDPHDLDILRVRHKAAIKDDGSNIIFFRGSALGSFFVTARNPQIYDNSENTDDIPLTQDEDYLLSDDDEI
jgi:hypothetical protein